MKRTVVVVFHEGAHPEILTGVDPKDFRGRADCLIDPVLPKHVPPDRWTLVNGKIEVADKTQHVKHKNHPRVQTNRRLQKRHASLTAVAASAITALIMHFFHL